MYIKKEKFISMKGNKISNCEKKKSIFFVKWYIPADTGTAVINPKVTNKLYVTAALNCVKI